jgi:(1->4)-alpha-D-glucan 1-alpha-D-glucosylmutase
VSTSWADPSASFEGALHAVVDRIYDDPALSASVSTFAAEITPAGWSNALGQKLVQLAMPGVPDVYQGTELWEDSLVDPDNRRPVDFAARAALLARLDGGWEPAVDETGAVKLLVVSRTLRLRRDRPDLFAGYRQVPAFGPAADHVVAFDRGGAIAVATRLPVGLSLGGGWGETYLTLPGNSSVPDDSASSRRFTDSFTGRVYSGRRVPVSNLLDRYPVALLTPAESVVAP